MTLTEATLTEITRRLVATYQPDQVVLFGSHAWGEPDENSDVDLLVVFAESDPQGVRQRMQLTRSFLARKEREYEMLNSQIVLLREELAPQAQSQP